MEAQIEQAIDDMAADEAGGSRNKDGVHSFSSLPPTAPARFTEKLYSPSL
jgi:hypothetical protein